MRKAPLALLTAALVLAGCDDSDPGSLPLPEDAGVPDSGGPPRAAVGASCWADSDCVEGASCWTWLEGFPGGYCVIEDCTEASCPAGSQCETLSDGFARCLKSCTYKAHCRAREGYECEPEAQFCWPAEGAVPPGGSCAYDEQCEGDGAVCIRQEGFLGGYCLIPYCDEDCPAGSACRPILSEEATACIPGCAKDADCRQGYRCVTDPESEWRNTCYPGCRADADCPTGHGCRALPESGNKVCLDVSRECSASNPAGDCPEGLVCDRGVCRQFRCDDKVMEPNQSRAEAVEITASTPGLQICEDDEDWFSFGTEKADTVYQVGIDSNFSSGDLDVDLVDGQGAVRGYADLGPYSYNPENPVGPTNLQLYGFLGAPGSERRWLRVWGVDGAENNYGLVVRELPWKDGPRCEDLFSRQQCRAETQRGAHDPSQLMVFPLGNPKDPFAGDAFFFRNGLSPFGNPEFTTTGTLWARRELVMMLRHAYHEVEKAFPGTRPLGLGDIGLPDGTTPDGHPNGTHYYGANVDIAYFIRPDVQGADGNLTYRQICCDKPLADWSCVDTNERSKEYGTCVAGSEATHIVDVPRTALFVAKLAGTGRLRVVGFEAKVKADLVKALDELVAAGTLTAAERAAALSHVATALDHGSWIWHFNHMHASFCAGECTASMPGLWPDMELRSQERAARAFWHQRGRRALPAAGDR